MSARGLARFAAAGVSLLLAGCQPERSASPAAAEPPPPLEAVAAPGIDFRLQCGRGAETTILDTIGHGAAVVDLDRDDLPDLVFTGRDRVAAYRNLGGFRFERADLGLRQPGRWGGIAVADVDNNGWPDLYLAGYDCAALYLNEGGRLREATPGSGLESLAGKYAAWGTSAGFADLDQDGLADLVVCRYLEFEPDLPQRCRTHVEGVTSVCPPKVYEPQRPRVYRNLGAGRFRDVTEAWGVDGHGAALGVAFQDVDGDGKTDIAVANDERPSDLFVRRGGRFVEMGAASSIAYDRQGRVYAGMGLDWGDVDGDGKPDLAATSFYGEDKPFFLNLGGAQFREASGLWGLAGATLTDVAFGARFLDVENDGRPDLLVANGHIQENASQIRSEASYPQPVRLFRNAGQRFEPVLAPSWPVVVGRALATGDLDNDGGMDAVVSNLEGAPLLLRNRADRGHWLGVRLEGRRANRMGLGARVEVTVNGRTLSRELHTAGSYMASSDPRLLFGLGGAASIARVTVRWPGGGVTTQVPARTDQWITIREEAADR